LNGDVNGVAFGKFLLWSENNGSLVSGKKYRSGTSFIVAENLNQLR